MLDSIKTGKRIKELRGQVSQEQCANDLGISRGALSFYENGDRKPDAEVLYKMCKHFGVSADYILGLSDIKSPDEDIKTACKVTGLKENSVLAFVDLRKNHAFDEYSTRCVIETLNLFLKDWNFFCLLMSVFSWISSSIEYSQEKEKNSETLNNDLNESQQSDIISQKLESVEKAKKLLNSIGFEVVEADLINDLKMNKAKDYFCKICYSILEEVESDPELLQYLIKLEKERFEFFQYYEKERTREKIKEIFEREHNKK